MAAVKSSNNEGLRVREIVLDQTPLSLKGSVMSVESQLARQRITRLKEVQAHLIEFDVIIVTASTANLLDN